MTAADYQVLLRKIPGLIVENSRVLTGFAGPEDRRITLVVQGAGRAREQALPSYEENIRRVMDRHRLLTTQIHVVWPRRVELVVRGRLAAAPYGQDAPGQVRRRIEQFVRDLNQKMCIRDSPRRRKRAEKKCCGLNRWTQDMCRP